jgi:hypothetical protein
VRIRFKLIINVTGIAIKLRSITPSPTNSAPGLCENITAVPIKSCKHMGSITKNINFILFKTSIITTLELSGGAVVRLERIISRRRGARTHTGATKFALEYAGLGPA